jgi:putative transcriptional regulator
MSLHTKPDLAEAEPFPGVYFAAKKPHLDALVLDEKPTYKIFLGHAGWGAGQLENELRQGAWRTMPATIDAVLSTNDMLWEIIFRQLGQSTLKSILNLKELPSDPTVN